MIAPHQALASRPSQAMDPGRTYVTARAAALSGDHGLSAQLFANLVDSDVAGPAITRKAVSEAISAGNMPLALRLVEKIPQDALPIDARLLLAAQAVRAKRTDRAVELLADQKARAELSFLNPYLLAWAAADRRDTSRAMAALAAIQPNNVLGGAKDEHLALILLKLGRAAEAEPYATRALATAGGREQRLRLAFADGFVAAGDRARALAMLQDTGLDGAKARAVVEAGKRSGLVIDSTAEAYSELLLRLAIELNQLNAGVPIGLAQIARYVAPENDGAALLLAALLESRGRVDDALGALRSVRPQSGLAAPARDFEVQSLVEAGRREEALAIAHAAAMQRGADAADHARLGDTFASLDRHNEAAAAYGRALALAAAEGPAALWPLYLLRASSYESAGRWPAAKADLQAALALAPDQPLILNFLGYAKLERGEDLDTAEALIRKASELAPEDASITDSLGWALYKRGRLEQAIEVLQRAARSDPQQAEIHEHLGDALYKAGRKYEARFAWRAALVTAEDDIAARVQAKIDSGLSAETAAP